MKRNLNYNLIVNSLNFNDNNFLIALVLHYCYYYFIIITILFSLFQFTSMLRKSLGNYSSFILTQVARYTEFIHKDGAVQVSRLWMHAAA